MSPREHRASLRRDTQEGSYCAQFKTYHDEMKENENEEPSVTEAELARVLELDAKATQGPWQCEGNVIFRLDEGAIVADLHEIDGATGFGLNDELITEYRTLTPRLARELAAARAVIKVARDAMKRADDRLHQICGAYMALAHNEPEKVLFDAIKEMGPDMTAVSAALAQLHTHTHE